jgi:hypothetical protein
VGELLAVNVLLEPDAATKVLAAELNAGLRRGLPAGSGFTFDETHLPHVTLVQRYVRRDDLERVLDAVGEVVARVAAGAGAEDLCLRAGGLGGGELGTPKGTVLASVEFEPQAAVRALHDSLLRALDALAAAGGSAAAFFRLPGEPPPNAATVAYVEEFVPAHSGEDFAPHLTAGVAREDVLRELARDHPLTGARVMPAGAAVAHHQPATGLPQGGRQLLNAAQDELDAPVAARQ